MLHIQCNSVHRNEKEYLFSVIFNEFLGVKFTTEFKDEVPGYILTTGTGHSIHLEDAFFSRFSEPLSYLTNQAIPQRVAFVKNQFTIEADIPLLFGNGDFSGGEKDGKKSLRCGMDIFASVFFMLTRWEECVVKECDRYGRFPAPASLSYRFNFSNRPVVNEWLEMLWKMLEFCDIQQPRKQREYRLLPTCDVDLIHYPCDILTLLGDLKNTHNPLNPLKRIYWKLSGNNPYDCLSWMMDLSEKASTIMCFYFMANGTSKIDNTYRREDPLFKRMSREVLTRNHIVGIHPGFDTYLDAAEWKKQKNYLEEAVGGPLEECRQHYLRMDIVETPRIWQAASMKRDSTLGYTETQGFRCGTGDEFTLFDFMNRKPLQVKELPLVVMDTTLHPYKNAWRHLDKAPAVLEYYRGVCKKYKMPFTILFHNSSFDEIRWKGWKELYTRFLSAEA